MKRQTDAINHLNDKMEQVYKDVRAIEAVRGTDTASELKLKVNKMLQDMSDYVDQVSQVKADTTSRMDALEQSLEATRLANGATPESMSMSQQLVEQYTKAAGIEAKDLDGSEYALRQLVQNKFFTRKEADVRRFLFPQRFTRAVTSLDGSGGPLQVPAYEEMILPPGEESITLLDRLPTTSTNRSQVHWRTEVLASRTNNAGIRSLDFTGTDQGVGLGVSDFVFADHNIEMRTFGHVAEVSMQMLQDQPQLEGYINGRMRYMIRYDLEDEVLLGTNSGKSFRSINSAATAFNLNLDDAIGLSQTQRIDVLRLAKLQGDNTYIPTTAFILNRNDVAAIQTLKDTDGRYLFTNNVNQPNEMRPWGVPVIASNHVTQDVFYAIPLNMCELCVRREWESGMSFENNDNFEKLMVTLRIYGRYGFKMYYPASMIKGTFKQATS